jgi:hypothetical protein
VMHPASETGPTGSTDALPIGARASYRVRQEVVRMQASVGDRVVIHGRIVGAAERSGEVIEVRGSGENPLLVVRYDDGHEAILSPGSDCEVRHAS